MKRRDFIKNLGLVTGAGTVALSLNGMPMKAYAKPYLNIQASNGNILVIIQLKGGNDGLNTVVPYSDGIYRSLRPTIRIEGSNLITYNDKIGFPTAFESLVDLFGEDKMTIVQNVGYENQNRSHFRSTDIWLSASDADEYVYDGWVGRYLEKAYPDYPNSIPEQPMAIQLGAVQSLALESQYGGMGVAFQDPNTFYQLVFGNSVDDDPPPDTFAGEELSFLKQVMLQSIQYAEIIKEKADAGENVIEYPDTELAEQLSIIASLISGGMETPVYLTTHGSFDTHTNQSGAHKNLLTTFSEAVSAFYHDLKEQGLGDKVIIMTMSEFGRRVAENGSGGTDHGAAAPLFIIGENASGGFVGDYPDLQNLDFNGDLIYEFDFRQVYASLLKYHFGMDDSAIEEILFREFEYLPILKSAANSTGVNDEIPQRFELCQNYPNPFGKYSSSGGMTTIKYSVARAGKVSLVVYDALGRRVKTLVNAHQTPGVYVKNFNPNGLASGTYIYQLRAGNFVKSRKMILVK
jgi:uncharacterized protein (DUF1501 family)